MVKWCHTNSKSNYPKLRYCKPEQKYSDFHEEGTAFHALKKGVYHKIVQKMYDLVQKKIRIRHPLFIVIV